MLVLVLLVVLLMRLMRRLLLMRLMRLVVRSACPVEITTGPVVLVRAHGGGWVLVLY